MEGNKTGALLACAASIGAVLGGADDRTADALEGYGYHLGLAFQAVDDLLGIWGDPVGHRQADLERPAAAQEVPAGGRRPRRGRPGLRAAGRAPRRRRQEPADFDDFCEEEFATRAALIEEAGGREWTSQEARRQHATAIEALDEVDMPERGTRRSSWRSPTSSSSGRDDHYRPDSLATVAGRRRGVAPADGSPNDSRLTLQKGKP